MSIFFKKKLFFLIASALFSLCGCSTPVSERGQYIFAYQSGGIAQAEAKLTQTINNEIPQKNYTQSKDAVWLLLDRATTRFAMNNVEGAINDYKLALEAIDYYEQICLQEAFSQVLLADEVAAYPGEDFEQILARVYFALALLNKGDLGNAYALLRQSEEVQQKKKEFYRSSELTADYQLIDNSLAKYLFALLLEKRGEKSNAEILYQQTAALLPSNSCKWGQYETEFQLASSNQATVVVVCHNGNVPIKASGTSSASVASAMALEIMLAGNNIDPAWSSLTGIPVPILMQNWGADPSPTYATMDGIKKNLLPWYDVAEVANQQLDQKIPLTVARGVARFLLRRGTIAVAHQQDPTLGILCDIGMLFANASTKADTRSWTTLPNAIDLTRYNLDAGEHTLSIRVNSPACPAFVGNYRLDLAPHDLCVINVFNIHPGITTVIIPDRFNKGESK